jgi:uncharacterized protein (DUF302 family)
MNDFTLSATVDASYDDTVARVRGLLGDAGFGVLTEIDIQATLRAKLDVEVPARVILGACRPQLAHRALEADPRVATLLPCNVVVADAGNGRTRVELFDPSTISLLSDDADIAGVASEARERLIGMMATLTSPTEDTHEARA